MDKFKSRKFWIMITAVVGLVTAALSGNIEWGKAIQDAVYLIIGYFGANGIEHIAGMKKK